MSLNKRLGPHKEMSFAKAGAPYSLRFNAAGVTPCTGVVQDEGIVTAVGGVTRTGAGTYVITLNQRFQRINCSAPTVLQTGDIYAKVTAVVEGVALANTITIETVGAGAVADPVGGAVVELNFRVLSSVDG